jgi:hypothetical protein
MTNLNINQRSAAAPRLALAGKGVAIAVVLAGVMAACSANEPDAERTATQSSKPTSKETPSRAVTVQGARQELEGFDCSADDKGVWAAKGTLTNPSSSGQKYTVSVFVTNKKTATVLGEATKTVEVAPKKSMQFSMPRVAVSTQKNLLCTPLVTKELVK